MGRALFTLAKLVPIGLGTTGDSCQIAENVLAMLASHVWIVLVDWTLP
jgi:hypothetical protein